MKWYWIALICIGYLIVMAITILWRCFKDARTLPFSPSALVELNFWKGLFFPIYIPAHFFIAFLEYLAHKFDYDSRHTH